jgi:hypothetical protein
LHGGQLHHGHEADLFDPDRVSVIEKIDEDPIAGLALMYVLLERGL